MLRLCLGVVTLAIVSPAHAEFVYRGYIMSDARVSLPGKTPPAGQDALRFMRLDNSARLTTRFGTDGVQAHVDLLTTYRGGHADLQLEDLSRRTETDPFDVESDALYVHVSDILVEGLDLMVGRQIVNWGAADQFNPTSVLNPLDLEDPTRFGDRVANEMLLLRYSAPWSWYGESVTYFDELSLTFAAVPTHRPGQLPDNASDVFADPDLFVQFVNNETLKGFGAIQKTIIGYDAEFDYETQVASRGARFKEAQLAARMSAIVLGVDASAMVFKGVSDVLEPERIGVQFELPAGIEVPGLDELDALDEFLGLVGPALAGMQIPVTVELGYPEVEVVGFDFSTSLDAIGGLGLWVEAALTKHDAVMVSLDAGALGTLELTEVEKGSFWKVAAGTDYSILSWWYVNAQYLHGFVDEFGADDLDDYVVVASDLKFDSDRLLLRLATIYQIQDQSYVVYPQLSSTHWQNTALSLGAFIMGGADDSKFGSPAAGQSRLFFNARHSF